MELPPFLADNRPKVVPTPDNEASSRATSPPSSPTPPPTKAIDPVQSAEKIKEEGNAKFKAQQYADAVDLYTEAIGKCKKLLPRDLALMRLQS